MLKVKEFDPKSAWLNGGSTSMTFYKKGTTMEDYTVYGQPAYLLPGPSEKETVVEGIISNGPINHYGERACFHSNVEGTVTIDDAVLPLEIGEYFTHQPGFKIGSRYFTDVLFPGSDQSSGPFVGSEYNSLTKVATVYFRTAFIDGVYYLGRYYSNTTVAGYPDNGYFMWMVWHTNALFYRTSVKNVSGPTTLANFLTTLPSYVPPVAHTSKVTVVGYAKSGSVDQLIFAAKQLTKTISVFDDGEQDEKVILGELAQRAVERTRLTSTNGLQFLIELRTINSTLASLFAGFNSVEAAASAYLAGQYGVESQLRDVDAYLQAARRSIATTPKPWRASRSGLVLTPSPNLTIEYHYKVIYTSWDSDIMKCINLLDDLSLMPSLEMAWDFIPFSFLLDWFVNVGDVLDTLDSRRRMASYDVLNVTWSKKTIRKIHPNSMDVPFNFLGTMYRTLYTRKLQDYLNVPQITFDPPEEFNNVVELTALLVANK